MQHLEELLDQDIQFTGISRVVELFPAPIPETIPTDDEDYTVDEASELFRMSHWFGTTELCICPLEQQSQQRHQMENPRFLQRTFCSFS